MFVGKGKYGRVRILYLMGLFNKMLDNPIYYI